MELSVAHYVNMSCRIQYRQSKNLCSELQRFHLLGFAPVPSFSILYSKPDLVLTTPFSFAYFRGTQRLFLIIG